MVEKEEILDKIGEVELTMELPNNKKTNAGNFWITAHKGESHRRLVSLEYNGYFKNIPQNTVLSGLILELTELGCTGPITVLPEPTHEYHENIEISEKDHQWMYHFIRNQEDKIYQIQIFLSGKNGIYYITHEHELLHYIQNLYKNNEITEWIFFHMKNKGEYPNDYKGFYINSQSTNKTIKEEPDAFITNDSMKTKYQDQA